MASRKAQSKAGVPARRRGQQMGDERSNSNEPAKLEEARAQTPALRGRRAEANEFFADDSSQAVGANAARQRSNTPSVPAANPTNAKKGEPGGEKVFKQRQAGKKR